MHTKGCGIVCEYNPFHKGHAYQIEYVKKVLELPVVCAMSGNFVQRGEPACMDKKYRAQDAVKNGASVVLEIPFPYCSMTAERFARAGVEILDKSGMCSHIAFGSECADVEKLSEIAEFLLEDTTEKSIQVYQSNNPYISYAVAREAVICRDLGAEYADICENPNDILAIEYIKAIKQLGSSLIPVAVKRTVERAQGSDGVFASSSHIRSLMISDDMESAGNYVPDAKNLEHFTSYDGFYKALHISLMTRTPESLAGICELGGGLEYAVIKAAKSSAAYAEMFEKLRCKTLTDAKIKRMLLFAFLDVSKERASLSPAYTEVLALGENETASELMRICRKQKRITVAQRVSSVKKDALAKEQYEFCRNAENILRYSK